VAGLTDTPVTGTTGAVTVTAHVEVKPPSDEVTVILAVPGDTDVTRPVILTVATLVLLLLQLMLLLVALAGVIVAFTCPVWPVVRDNVAGLTVMPVTGTVTVTEAVALNEPSSVVAVMVAEPDDTPETSPFSFTVATLVLLLVQVTFLLVALAGLTVAAITPVPPGIRVRVAGVSDIPVTGTAAAVTVIAQVAVLLPSTVVTVMWLFLPFLLQPVHRGIYCGHGSIAACPGNILIGSI
jgi:hypothetical protein